MQLVRRAASELQHEMGIKQRSTAVDLDLDLQLYPAQDLTRIYAGYRH